MRKVNAARRLFAHGAGGRGGALVVDGPANPELYKDFDPARSAMVMSH